MLLILDERSLIVMLFKTNNASFYLCEHEAKKRGLNDCLLIRSLFIKVTLNDDYERVCSCFLTRIKTIFIICFIMNDDRLIISLSSRLIVIFNFFLDKPDSFESENNSLLIFESKSF